MLSSPSSPLVTEVHFEADEKEHLTEGDGHQGEIYAAAMRDKQRDDGAEDRRRQHASQQTQPEVLYQIELREAESVGADAEIGAVAERRQPPVAEQHVVAQRIDAENQHLDAEIGIQADLADPEG